MSDNGDGLYWLTRDHPDQWTVVVGEARSPVFEEHAMAMSDFLAAFVTGTIASKILPADACERHAVTFVEGLE